jgi:hypothetical protein
MMINYASKQIRSSLINRKIKVNQQQERRRAATGCIEHCTKLAKTGCAQYRAEV